MRRAAVRALRTACHQTARGLSRSNRHAALPRPSVACAAVATGHLAAAARGSVERHFSSSALDLIPARRPLFGPPPPPPPPGASGSTSRTNSTPGLPLHASMYIRRTSLALLSGIVAYSAYYAYQGEGNAGSHQAALLSTKVTPEAALATGEPGAVTADAAQMTRNVLVIGANELSTGTLVSDEPIVKMTDNSGRRVLEMLSPDQATQRLRRNEESYDIQRGQGVLRYDLVQLASNDPIEDDHAEKIVEIPARGASEIDHHTTDWMFWGVFDGHSGWTTSAKLRQALIKYVARELNETYKAVANNTIPPADAIDGAIKVGFTRLDDDIVHQNARTVLAQSSKTVAAELLAPALSGSCALLSFYDSQSQLLRVACTGDSRAVLGRRSTTTGKWTATPLSVDQTGSNPDEVARLQRQHPGEKHVVRNGRILGGLEPSRAFGDASYKWTRDVADRLRNSFFGRSQSPLMSTPPYVTAEPVVTTTKIEPDKGDFVVMATDGLWEMLTNEEAVGLVGTWIEQQRQAQAQAQAQSKSSSSSTMNAAWNKIFGRKASAGYDGALPVETPGADANTHGERTPIRLRQWGISPDDRNRFVVEDQNAATHLVRNALGGANGEQVSALLTLPAPFSRRYRDDLTVQVIFFGNGAATGNVVVNQEATGPAAAIKAKL